MGGKGYELVRNVRFGPGEMILEVGSDRSEGSTLTLAEVAVEMNVPMVTIDMDPHTHQTVSGLNQKNVSAVAAVAEEYLLTLDRKQKIKFAYLDGFDWPYDAMSDEVLEPYARAYRGNGMVLSKYGSKCSHLALAAQVHSRAADECTIVFDDTWRSDTDWDGKGAWGVPFLLNNGYEIVEAKPFTKEHDAFVAVRMSSHD